MAQGRDEEEEVVEKGTENKQPDNHTPDKSPPDD
jgi:hypothetical protein